MAEKQTKAYQEEQRVSKLQRRLQEVEAENKQLKRVLGGVPGLIYSFSTRSGAVFYSPQVESVLGYTELDPMRWHDAIHPEDLPRVDQVIENSKQGQAFEVEYRIQDAWGHWHWFRDRSIAHRMGDDEVIIDGMATDITEYKEMARALSTGDSLVQKLMDSIPHPVMVLDKDRTILSANKAAREAGARMGCHCWNSFAKNQYLSSEQLELLEKEGPSNKIHCNFCQVGPMLKSGRPQNSPDLESFGRVWDTWWVPVTPEIYLHYAIDVTERKQAEEIRAESHDQLIRILDGVQAVVYVCDIRTHDLLYMNQHSLEIFGPAKNNKCWQHFHRGQSGPCRACRNRETLLQRGRCLVYEQQNSRDKKWYQCRDYLISWTDGRDVRLHIAVDISARKAAEQLLEERVQEKTARLTPEVEHRREVEKSLETKTRHLTEANLALKAMLDFRDAERRAIEENVSLKIQQQILPHIQDIELQNVHKDIQVRLAMIKDALMRLSVPSHRSPATSGYSRLTPMEIRVADLVKQGRQTKEISQLLNISPASVSTHRNNIRKKFNLNNKKTNLRVFLSSLEG